MLKDFNFNTLISNIPTEHVPENMNLILEGGCMNGAYEIGGLLFIKMLEKKNLTSIDRISGASVGAYAGFLYLTDNLEHYVDDYNKMKEKFKKNLILSSLQEQLTILVNNLSHEQFSSLQKDKLFVTFYNIETGQQQLKSCYQSREELISTILKSCHIPYLINGECFYKENEISYMDGCFPFIFPKHQPSKKNLYMRLSQLNRLKTILNVSYEKTIHGRILEGLLETYNFFLKNRATTMCSFTEGWSIQDKLKNVSLKVVFQLLIWGLYLLNISFTFIKPKLIEFKKTHLFKHFSPILKKIYKKIILYLVFM